MNELGMAYLEKKRMFNLMLVVQLQKINGNMHFNVTRKISARLRMHGAFTHTRMVSEKFLKR